MQNNKSHRNPPPDGYDKKVKQYHDFAAFAAIKDTDMREKAYQSPEGYYPVNETIARHINGIKLGESLFRICKFYYVHGSTNIRECENCGKMMIILGTWTEIPDMPEDLFSPPPFRTDLKRAPRTKEEEEAHSEGKYDAVQCSFCGNMTYAYNSAMIMQTAYKGEHTSFLEEIQRDAKVSLSGAKHVILLGYQLPPDDVIWRSAIVAKQNKEEAVYCSVVVGIDKDVEDWIDGDDLMKYIKEKKSTIPKEEWAGFGINAIDAAIAIFGKKNVRAYTGGIPKVWCSGNAVDKGKVEELLYPKKRFPNGVADMRKKEWEKNN